MTKTINGVNLDAILTELGQFGRYQIRTFCFILVPIMFGAMHNGQYIFNAATTSYRLVYNNAGVTFRISIAQALLLLFNLAVCHDYYFPEFDPTITADKFLIFEVDVSVDDPTTNANKFLIYNRPRLCLVPECETGTDFTPGYWGLWTLPKGEGRCQRLQPLGPSCSSEDFHQNNTIQCTQWVYENDYSIVPEFDLACEEWKRTMVGTIHSVGLFVALPFTGYFSDRFGRRKAFLVTTTSAGITGLIRSYSSNYYFYLVMEFIEPALSSGAYSTGFILALEMVGPKWRVLGGNIITCFFALGQALLALTAWHVPQWRFLTRILYVPSLLFVFYIFVIEESVRWLLSKGMKKEAARILLKAAAINKKQISSESIRALSDESHKDTKEKPNMRKEVENASSSTAAKRSIVRQVLKSRIIMFRLCICSFWWITLTFVYYGLSINSVSLAGNSYINYMLTSLVEIPGYFLSFITLDHFGRKKTIMTTFFVCGISLIVLPFIPQTLLWLSTVLTMLSKLAISMAFSSIYIYTSELFPTNARHSLLGFCSMVGRVGSIVAPMTPLLMEYMATLPYIIFSAMAVVAGGLMFLAPETLHQELPDTIAQAENIQGHYANKSQSGADDKRELREAGML